MKYLRQHEMTEPGYYWWLPSCLEHEPEKDENWQVLSWHPMNDARQKSGVFYGPLPAPTFKLIHTPPKVKQE